MNNTNLISYPIVSLFDYLPVRYSATTEQTRNRFEVYHFKEGKCSERVCNELETKIKMITGSNKCNWIITFIPGSTTVRTMCKYQSLAAKFISDLDIEVSLTAIYNLKDRETTLKTGKIADPTSTFGFQVNEFKGKNVILIDDVITTGRSFKSCADKLMDKGADRVFGLFVANTINPDRN